MDITFDTARFLRHCKENQIDFESTLQIGRQNCFFSSEEMKIKYGDFAESYFHLLGAKRMEENMKRRIFYEPVNIK
jgi:hypothetical protein